jgi:photosystem II stability/assembly factor-like uncharacterized protein
LVVFNLASAVLDVQGTTDSGESWSKDAQIKGSFRSVALDFRDSKQGWIAARGETRGSGGIWLTKDGGGTWIRQ